MSLRNLFRSAVAVIALCLLPAAALAQAQNQGPDEGQGLPQSLAASRITQAVDNTKLITLQGNVHPLAQARNDRGAAPVSMATGKLLLVLKGSQQQQSALRQYLDSVQVPGSAAYRKWLTPEQFGQFFGPTTQDIQTVTAWLQSQGFEVSTVSPAGTFIEFSGSVGQVNTAFHAAMHRYAVNGESHMANSVNPQIPAALAPVVAGVAQLNDFFPKSHAVKGASGYWDEATQRVKTNLTLFGSNNVPALFAVPADAATIYDTPNSNLNANYSKISSLVGGKSYDGTGITIGIAGDSDITTAPNAPDPTVAPYSDILAYRTAWLNDSNTGHLPSVIVDGNDPGINSDVVEAMLDTQIAGGIAPGAKINFYTSANTDLQSGLFFAIIRALDDNQVSILNVSFGQCEVNETSSGNQFILSLWEQAAAQGITVTVSTGDSGSASCDNPNTETTAVNGLAVSGLASTPYNIAVGGTDYDVLQTNSTSFSQYVNATTSGSGPYFGTALSYIPEAPWNNSTVSNTTIAANTPYQDASNGNVTNIVAAGGGLSSAAVCNFSLDQNGNCTGNPLGYAKPAFQSSLTPNDGVRDLPDISLLAGNGFYGATWNVCLDPTISPYSGSANPAPDCQLTNGQLTNTTYFDGVGGTSAAAPAFAGMLALIAQSQGGVRLGQADNVLYNLAGSKYSTIFHDVITGDNSVVCTPGSPNCGPTPNNFLSGYNTATGYDTASGLGSIDVAQLTAAWSSVTFTPTSTSFSINSSTAALNITHGTPFTYSASVTPGASTGFVAIESTSTLPNQGSQVLAALTNGTAGGTYNGLPGGSYNVYAYYGGDATHAASSSNQIAVNVSPENSTTSLLGNFYDAATGNTLANVSTATTTAIPYGSYSGFHATPYGNASQTVNGSIQPDGIPTGTVAFVNNGTTVNTAAVNSQGEAVYFLTTLSPGTYSMVANYSGDPGLNPSTSNTIGFAIAKAATTTAVSPASTSIQSSASAVLKVAVSADSVGAQPTGTISVLNGGTIIASTSTFTGASASNGTVSPTAQLTIPGTALASGANTLTVSYSGDANYGGSSATSVVTISSTGTGSSFAVTGSNVTLSAGSTVPSTITVTPAGGFTGQVNLTCLVSNQLGQSHIPGCNFGGTATGSVTVSGTAAATTSMNITTTANTASLAFPLDKYFNAAGGTALACLLIFAVPARRRSWRTMLGLLIVIVSVAGIGCGSNGPSQGNGTPTGNYSVTVTGTDAATGKITSTSTVTVTVQ